MNRIRIKYKLKIVHQIDKLINYIKNFQLNIKTNYFKTYLW